MTGAVALYGRLTLRSLLRRRLATAVLVFLPVAFYAATHDAVGRSVRSLLFGVTWAVSTVAFFSATPGRQLEPRLRLGGWSARSLLGGRVGALVALALVIGSGYWALVAVDRSGVDRVVVGLDFVVTGVVAVAFGSALGAVVDRELEGSLLLFLFAGLQAVANPFSTVAKLLPFWSSRELGTVAVDGAAQASVGWGLAHAALVVAACASVVVVVELRR